MGYKAIVSNWNGTVFQYPTDEVQNKMLAYAALEGAKQAILKGRFRGAIDIAKVLLAERAVKRGLEKYRRRQINIPQVYEPFNRGVLDGRTVGFVNGVVDQYARESVDKVDERVLRPIRVAHDRGKKTGILSASYDYSIRKILQEADFEDVFDNIVANTLETEGDDVIGMTLKIYDRRVETLRFEFINNPSMVAQGFTDKETVYFGGSEDDEPIAPILAPGNFVVPFFASNGFKQRMASKHGAFVPQDEKDLERYLETK